MLETLDIELKPFLKWPGGKSKELKVIIPNMPIEINNYYEPFVGGGAVYFATINANHYFINDKSKDIIDLYSNIKKANNFELFNALTHIDNYWKLLDVIYINNRKAFFDIFIQHRKSDKYDLKCIINEFIDLIIDEFILPLQDTFNFDSKFYIKEIKLNLTRKMSRMKQIELQKGLLSDEDVDLNILTALKSAYYMYFRMLYNKPLKYGIDSMVYSSIYFFIRNYTYSGMFRYNSNGEFNVPYGGIGYNNNTLDKKIRYISSQAIQDKLRNTTIECKDFSDFIKSKELQQDDFIFLDPPYDTEFSTYDQNEFTYNDQVRLANFLVNEVSCKWMLIIKNTSLIHDLYCKPNIHINYFDKSYSVSFMNRNDRNTEHLMITNYGN